MNWAAQLQTIDGWDVDKKDRFQLNNSQNAFHKSVPVLEYLDWQILDIQRGSCETVLPLNVESSNQYLTQQAALMLLSADYTGGIALCTLFDRVPIIGFHPQKDDYGAYMWGAKATIKWYRPSTEDLVCKAKIPKEDWARLADRFFNGRNVIVTIPVMMYNKGVLVAKADFTYWARNSHSLYATGTHLKTTHLLLEHKVKTSAKLIAGLRALNDNPISTERDNLDPYAKQVAGKQGLILARKFCLHTPQLKEMIRARTLHLDQCLKDFSEKHDRFSVINIGCGFDARPWRLKHLNISRIYELDLPIMLNLRELALPAIAESSYPITRIPVNLLENSIEILLKQAEMNLFEPAFFIWEGGSMYFSKQNIEPIFKSIANLMLHTHSVLWLDYASEKAVFDQTGITEIENFMGNMSRMGEAFVNGYDQIKSSLNPIGLSVAQQISCGAFMGSSQPIYQHYNFCLIQRARVTSEDKRRIASTEEMA